MCTEKEDSHNGFLTHPVKSDNLVRDLDGQNSLQHSAHKKPTNQEKYISLEVLGPSGPNF